MSATARSNGEAASKAGTAYANGTSHSLSSHSANANGTHKASMANGSSPARNSEPYFGHDREEVTRLIIQALADMGYHSSADGLSKESGYELESPVVASFRQAVLAGDWDDAERLLFGTDTDDAEGATPKSAGLALTQTAEPDLMRFWIRQQKLLELLEKGETSQALTVLRTELTPLNQESKRIPSLSTLFMCQHGDELKARAQWDGANGNSRRLLLSELSKCISSSVMLREHRLSSLLHQVKCQQINKCEYHSSTRPPSLYYDHSCDRRNFPTLCISELDEHANEVWQVVFSHNGQMMASCGSEGHVYIWAVPSFQLVHKLVDHTAGVGNVAWSWNDDRLVTCSQDKHARLWEVSTGTLIKTLDHLGEPISCCVWAPDDKSFIVGSLDKVRGLTHWDRDGKKLSDWASPHRVEDLAVSPDGHWLVSMDVLGHLHVYNFLTHEHEYEVDLKIRATSITISRDSRLLLVNLPQQGTAQLFDLKRREVVQRYKGHTGGNFMIRSTFGGADESFVASGSEDGFLYIWHKIDGHTVMKLSVHHPRCNSVSWCAADPRFVASCGDDGKIKIHSNNDGLRIHTEAAAEHRRQQLARGIVPSSSPSSS